MLLLLLLFIGWKDEKVVLRKRDNHSTNNHDNSNFARTNRSLSLSASLHKIESATSRNNKKLSVIIGSDNNNNNNNNSDGDNFDSDGHNYYNCNNLTLTNTNYNSNSPFDSEDSGSNIYVNNSFGGSILSLAEHYQDMSTAALTNTNLPNQANNLANDPNTVFANLADYKIKEKDNKSKMR